MFKNLFKKKDNNPLVIITEDDINYYIPVGLYGKILVYELKGYGKLIVLKLNDEIIIDDLVKHSLRTSTEFYQYTGCIKLFECCGFTEYATYEIKRYIIGLVVEQQRKNIVISETLKKRDQSIKNEMNDKIKTYSLT